MSRVGNQTIAVPDKVKVSIADNHVAVEGPKGKLEMDMPRRTSVSQEENTLKVTAMATTAKPRPCTGWAVRCSTTWCSACRMGLSRNSKLTALV